MNEQELTEWEAGLVDLKRKILKQKIYTVVCECFLKINEDVEIFILPTDVGYLCQEITNRVFEVINE